MLSPSCILSLAARAELLSYLLHAPGIWGSSLQMLVVQLASELPSLVLLERAQANAEEDAYLHQ